MLKWARHGFGAAFGAVAKLCRKSSEIFSALILLNILAPRNRLDETSAMMRSTTRIENP